MNPLKQWFDAHVTGAGVWKWEHYWEIYHRYLAKFRDEPVTVCEVGVYSGGSLELWREYFGPSAEIIGVDIQPACRKFESAGTRILIGDQADRNFWRYFWTQVPRVDVFIDDGGHEAHQQIATLEEVLPYLAPGGVYLCEDVHGVDHGFNTYMQDMARRLSENVHVPTAQVVSFRPTVLQADINSIHAYPYVWVIEKNERPVQMFEAPMRGTEWIHHDPAWR